MSLTMAPFSPHLSRIMRFFSPLLIACSLLLVGCAGDKTLLYRTTILNGQKFELEISQKLGPLPAKAGGLEVKLAAFMIDADKKQLNFQMSLLVENGRTPRQIKVEDVTDEVAVLLVEDANPKLAQNVWQASAAPIPFADPRLKWVLEIGDSLRIYRFTVVTADGKTVELLQGSFTSSLVKSGIRQLMGLKY